MASRRGDKKEQIMMILEHVVRPSTKQIVKIAKSTKSSERWVWECFRAVREKREQDSSLLSRIDKMAELFIYADFLIKKYFKQKEETPAIEVQVAYKIERLSKKLQEEFQRDERGRKVKEESE